MRQPNRDSGFFALAMAAILWSAAPAAAQGLIELRSAARIAPGAPVLLADVALLQGEEAAALGPVIIREQGAAGETVRVEDVRRAIDRAGRVNWGRLSIRGSTCVLGIAQGRHEERRAEPAAAATALTVDPAGTVRQLVAIRIGALAQAPAEDLRLTFAAEDDELLDLRTAGRTVEITPTGLSDRLPLAVRVFEGDRIVQGRTIRVGVEVRREVVIAGQNRRRGETIVEQDVARGEQWLGLAARPARLDQVIGASPRSRMTAGQVVMVEDVTPQLAVNKGEQVTVHCVSGTIVLTMRARATSAAREGELVQLEALDSKRTFYARMDGRGRAVVQVGSGHE